MCLHVAERIRRSRGGFFNQPKNPPSILRILVADSARSGAGARPAAGNPGRFSAADHHRSDRIAGRLVATGAQRLLDAQPRQPAG
ncbi:MAG: hypothetical protein D4S02_16810, partial [Rhodocyclaceae bacterium]